ncbi:Phage integrase, N-terminal SAM-like (plasmid) [Cupriavidus necator H850]|uniref:integrase domain-containing protein n=1 Tax=Cupriavidus necator TaxID=106590 RepID=UPI00129EA573|nr:integrase domain-containing protein [Cupriavidus necator]KAI3611776.1 Phage integrase, N-terminal SAM-like [Cupriavidus necator H850]
MSKGINLRAVLAAYNLPENFKAAFAVMAVQHLHLPHSGTRVSGRSLSQLTQRQRAQALLKMFVDLRKGGFALVSPYNLKQKHIQWLVQSWVLEQKLDVGSVELRLTHLRALTAWMGKANMVGSIDDYVERPADYKRSYIAHKDRSWEGNGVDALAKIAEIAGTDQHVALQLRLEAAFGLRAKESWRLRPLQDVLPSGHLHTVDGTKGGRPRKVPIEFIWQYDLLMEVANLAGEANPERGTLIPRSYTQARWRRHFYAVLEKHGITKNGCGVTAHGLRHQYFHQMYERNAGQAAAIKGGGKVIDRLRHEEAMRKIVEAAGHSRQTKANAYLSTYSVQAAASRPVVTPEMAAQAVKDAGGVKAKAAQALGITRQALYRLLARLPDTK